MNFVAIRNLLRAAWSTTGRPIEVGAFDPIETALGIRLPVDYKSLLLWSNGGETLPPLPYFKFYPIEDLLPRRADGQPPDVLEFCTDDSDGYAFDLTVSRDTFQYPILRYPLGETTRQLTERLADNLVSFVEKAILGAPVRIVSPTDRHSH